MLLFMCFAFMLFAISAEHTSIVWQVLSNLTLIVFLPLLNLPIPAQVNEISKGLSKFVRFDFIEKNGVSLMQ